MLNVSFARTTAAARAATFQAPPTDVALAGFLREDRGVSASLPSSAGASDRSPDSSPLQAAEVTSSSKLIVAAGSDLIG